MVLIDSDWLQHAKVVLVRRDPVKWWNSSKYFP